MNKYLVKFIISSISLTSCGSINHFHSQNKDHVLLAENDINYVVFENLDNNKIYLSKCSSTELYKLEKIYKTSSPSDYWRNSKSNLCHQPVSSSKALTKQEYLAKVFEFVGMGISAENKIDAQINEILTKLSQQISTHDNQINEFNLKIIELQNTFKLLEEQLQFKNIEQLSAMDVLQYLATQVSNGSGLPSHELEQLRANLNHQQNRIDHINQEIIALKTKLSTVDSDDVDLVNKKILEVKDAIEQLNVKRNEALELKKTEFAKLSTLRLPLENSLKPGVTKYMNVDSRNLIKVLDTIFK